MNTHAEKILILDFGSQYSQLIARKIRELGIYCELHPYDINNLFIKQFNPKGVILSGGPETVTKDFTPRIPPIIFQLNCPILGICYGMQAMAAQLGGTVEMAWHREFGYAQLELHGHSLLFQAIVDETDTKGVALLDVWMSHGDKVVKIPPGFKIIATTPHCPVAAMADDNKKFYGVQFHPEVSHTQQGKRILERFIRDICQCHAIWTSENIADEIIKNIKEQVGDAHVILGLSGGVDSSVVAALLHKAIGDQLVCVFVDTGLLRLGEVEKISTIFSKNLAIKINFVDAKKQFFKALENISDPEEKRKIIGQEFITLFEKEASRIPHVKWLAQGTIYSDVIESAATKNNKSQVIKSHHNVGGLPKTMHLKLLEPLRELFKDEVRKIGLELGLPADMIHRHPFPGPGLGVRILGEVKEEYADKLRLADDIFMEELKKQNLYDKVSQAFAVFLPIKSVGVIGDMRQYEPVIALRAVETVDFMTAHWAYLPYDFLARVSNRIINEVSGISRVVYDISGKPPATIEWE